jgi:hypothetical protein
MSIPSIPTLRAALLGGLLCATAPAAGATDTLVLDLSPFTPFAVFGEVWGVSTVEGEVVNARLDVEFVSNETGPWTLNAVFIDFPQGGSVGVDSVTEGWVGAGTFTKTIETAALNGTLAPPAGQTLWSWFMQWTGGAPFDLPGGGQGLGPVDGVFTTLTLTLFLETCPNGDPLRPWTDVGGALAGTLGEPALSASASLCENENGSILLENALPGGTANAVIGLTELQVPFKGGVLVPNPDVILFGLPIDGAGNSLLGFTWPAGIPSQLSFWVQHWIADPAAVKGLAASNGLRGTTP